MFIVQFRNGHSMKCDVFAAFKMAEMPDVIEYIADETGCVVWCGNEVTGLAPLTDEVDFDAVQYETPLVIPSEREWVVTTRSDIGDHSLSTSFAETAMKWFEQKVSKTWLDKPFYDEIRLYHNGVVVRAAVMGHEIVL